MLKANFEVTWIWKDPDNNIWGTPWTFVDDARHKLKIALESHYPHAKFEVKYSEKTEDEKQIKEE